MRIGKIIKTKDGFRWKIISYENGQTLGTSDQAFEHKEHAMDMLDRILKCSTMQTMRNTLVLAQNMFLEGKTELGESYIQSAIEQIYQNLDQIHGLPAQSKVKRVKKRKSSK
jgi:hypothetical protein